MLRRSIGSLGSLFLVLVISFAACSRNSAPAGDRTGLADPQAAALEKLRSRSDQPPKVQFEAGVPRFASFRVPATANGSADAVSRSLDFLESNQDLYRLQDPRAQLYLEDSTTNEAEHHVFFGQRRGDLPVFGAQLAVHIVDDAIVATNGNYLTEIPDAVTPALDENKAGTIALKDLGENARRIGRARLVYFDRSLFMTTAEIAAAELDADTHQAWRINAAKNSEGRAYSYFIDSATGAILFRLDLQESHAAQKDFTISTANNQGQGYFCGFLSQTNWFDENGKLPSAMPDAEGDSTFLKTHQIYDYFYTNFHRHGWNGNDGLIGMVLDDLDQTSNAAFSHSCSYFVFGDNMAQLDVMAHEFTHGINSTSASGGLMNTNQSGALNESYSDVFGAMVDTANWSIGEGLITPVPPGFLPTCSAPLPPATLRDLSNPPACRDPDHMNIFLVTTADRGGIHTNNGIPNKAAFLIAAGGTHNGITVTGIGRDKTAKLYYEVLTTWLTNNADFNNARSATLTVAQIWAASGKHGFTSADRCVVWNSFAAVGLGLPDLDCDGVVDVVDPDDDGDTINDAADNCPKVSNPGQQDSDSDSTGDACDADADNDGKVNTQDNCPIKANPDQADKDFDGVGDVCDDSDADGVPDSVDNCLFHKNSAQENKFDNDGIGDVCDSDIDDDGICNVVGPTFLGTSGGPACANPDNCLTAANPNQLDSDSDGYGNACDSCPTGRNSGTDTDGDQLDDACDPDDDNDEVPDRKPDNCPLIANSDQRDLDGDGKGSACDPDELPKLGIPFDIAGAIQFQRDRLDRYQIQIVPGLCRGVNCFPEGSLAEFRVTFETEALMRIVDDQGFVIAGSNEGLEKVFSFRPKPGFFDWPRSAPDGTSPFHDRQYFLEIFPPRDIQYDRPYRIRIDNAMGIQP